MRDSSTSINLYTNDATLVDNLLDDPTVLADHLADQVPGHLQRLLAVLKHRPGLLDRVVRLPSKEEKPRQNPRTFELDLMGANLAGDLERAGVLLELDVQHAVQLAGRLDVGAVRADRQPHQILSYLELVREPWLKRKV